MKWQMVDFSLIFWSDVISSLRVIGLSRDWEMSVFSFGDKIQRGLKSDTRINLIKVEKRVRNLGHSSSENFPLSLDTCFWIILQESSFPVVFKILWKFSDHWVMNARSFWSRHLMITFSSSSMLCIRAIPIFKNMEENIFTGGEDVLSNKSKSGATGSWTVSSDFTRLLMWEMISSAFSCRTTFEEKY